MSNSLKVLLATALGAGIGTITAMSIPSSIWWLGAIIGGLIGYLSYEFEVVVAAFKSGWKSIVEINADEWKALFILPVKTLAIGLIFIMLLTHFFTAIIGMSLCIIILVESISNSSVNAMAAIVLFYGIGCLYLIIDTNSEERDYSLLMMLYLVSPLGIVFYWLPMAI
ncbi:hypothetical protein ISR92_02065 [Patescibacteria group bacterium]|nr:hypothetical protein [Patescibacteria group bacterium]